MNPERHDLHSVWLCPEAATASTLSSLIRRIADWQAAPTFYPHVTVLGELSGMPEATIGACKALFTHHGPIEGRVLRVARSAEFFRSLTLEFALPQTVFAARATLSQAMSPTEASLFQPHLSLAYGAAPDCDLDKALLDRAHSFVGKTLLLDRLVITRSAQSIPIPQWSALEEIPLHT